MPRFAEIPVWSTVSAQYMDLSLPEDAERAISRMEEIDPCHPIVSCQRARLALSCGDISQFQAICEHLRSSESIRNGAEAADNLEFELGEELERLEPPPLDFLDVIGLSKDVQRDGFEDAMCLLLEARSELDPSVRARLDKALRRIVRRAGTLVDPGKVTPADLRRSLRRRRIPPTVIFSVGELLPHVCEPVVEDLTEWVAANGYSMDPAMLKMRPVHETRARFEALADAYLNEVPQAPRALVLWLLPRAVFTVDRDLAAGGLPPEVQHSAWGPLFDAMSALGPDAAEWDHLEEALAALRTLGAARLAARSLSSALEGAQAALARLRALLAGQEEYFECSDLENLSLGRSMSAGHLIEIDHCASGTVACLVALAECRSAVASTRSEALEQRERISELEGAICEQTAALRALVASASAGV